MGIRDKVREAIDIAASPMLDILSEIMLEGVAGAAVPGIGNMILGYKQRRAEKNIEDLIDLLLERQQEFDEKLKKLDAHQIKNITGRDFDLITEYAANERQKAKIKFIVNGYLNLPDQGDYAEDFVLLYYDTLEELSILDIRVLKLCWPGNKDDNSLKVMNDYKIGPDQLRYIVDKLYRMGLFKGKTDSNVDENFETLVRCLKENKEIPELKKTGAIGSHELSEFGIQFLQFFLNLKLKE